MGVYERLKLKFWVLILSQETSTCGAGTSNRNERKREVANENAFSRPCCVMLPVSGKRLGAQLSVGDLPTKGKRGNGNEQGTGAQVM